MEGAGEFLFGEAQALLGFLQDGDVAHDDDEGGDAFDFGVLCGEEAGEASSVAAAEGHFEVVQVFVLEMLEQAGGEARVGPEAELGGGVADGLGGADPGLLFEGLVDFEQAAVAASGEGDDVGAVVEDGGELLFGEA